MILTRSHFVYLFLGGSGNHILLSPAKPIRFPNLYYAPLMERGNPLNQYPHSSSQGSKGGFRGSVCLSVPLCLSHMWAMGVYDGRGITLWDELASISPKNFKCHLLRALFLCDHRSCSTEGNTFQATFPESMFNLLLRTWNQINTTLESGTQILEPQNLD